MENIWINYRIVFDKKRKIYFLGSICMVKYIKYRIILRPRITLITRIRNLNGLSVESVSFVVAIKI